MKAAIIGLPKSGKSTVYSAAAELAVDPYAPPEPRTAVVHVPDPRLSYLADLCHPKKVTEATIELVDVPGCALDDAKGREEWRRLLPVVRQVELLLVVLRDFENPSVAPHRGRVDAVGDFDAVWEELIFADLDTVTTRIERLEKSLKKPTKTHDAEKRELALLTRCQEALESEKPLASVLTTQEDRRQAASFAFLTEKPVVVVRNVAEDQVGSTVDWELPHVAEIITLGASIEAEIATLAAADRSTFLAELGLNAPARDRLIQVCLRAAGLITFLTMNREEARAWLIPRGSTAVEAAARVHTDLARGFIRAETVTYEDLVAHTDMKGAKADGRVRKEGKSYIVADGDILHILASV